MNKEITIYELLGLIKDGQAPKKIKYKGIIYEYIFQNGYTHKDDVSSEYFVSDFCADYEKDLNDKVEIIEEDNKIEKLNIKQEKNCKGNWKWKCNEYNISTPQKILGDKINELIDEVNKLKENKK